MLLSSPPILGTPPGSEKPQVNEAVGTGRCLVQVPLLGEKSFVDTVLGLVICFSAVKCFRELAMPLKIAVLAKQVFAQRCLRPPFQVDSEQASDYAANIPPVVNGFDENAVEAALQIKDAQEATITLFYRHSLPLDVMKKTPVNGCRRANFAPRRRFSEHHR